MSSKERIDYIKDYFRNEKINFKSWPVFWVLRIVFAALILISFNVQCFFMIMGASFSMGFAHNTEVEKILPLSDEDLKKKRMVKVNMVWMRYLIFGIAGAIYTMTFPKYSEIREHILSRPYMYFSFFILQMVMIYSTMLELMIENCKEDKFTFKQPIFKYIFSLIPTIIFWVYAVSSMRNSVTALFFMGYEWPHIVVMLTAALFLIIYNISIYKKWKIMDFKPQLVNIKAKGGNA